MEEGMIEVRDELETYREELVHLRGLLVEAESLLQAVRTEAIAPPAVADTLLRILSDQIIQVKERRQK
jgi:hypothetical protein